jgi:hypothetical protein
VILACRSVSIGLVINPLLQALIEPLRPKQLGDANTLFNTWQRIAGSFGIGLIAALYATQAHAHGPVPALHLTGVVLAVIALAGALAALPCPRSATRPWRVVSQLARPGHRNHAEDYLGPEPATAAATAGWGHQDPRPAQV